MTRRRILALSPIPEEGAGCRFRVSQFAPYLADAGFDIEIHPLFDTSFFRLVYQPGHYVRKVTGLASRTIDRIGVINSASNIDAVLIYREAYPVGPPLFERLIARRAVPIVYDFDDAVYLGNTSQANRVIGFLKNPDKVAEILRLSTHVIAGNEYLADYARRHSARVTVIPTCVDTEVWVPRRRTPIETTKPVIGWIGTPTTTPYLLELKDVLIELARTHSFVLRVSGSLQPVEWPGVDVENVAWTLKREVELFNTCDIGIYPLPDDEWTRGKCGFKAIQFMASAVPVVASPVGVNREIITDGKDGFFATGSGEWLAKLRALIENRELRHRVGEAGRHTIERRYSLAANAPRVVSIFEEVTTGAHRQAS
jgi:glycosyltransferase involved in cell wall biosynthesis